MDSVNFRIIFGVDFIHVSGVDSVNLCLASGLKKRGYNCQIISFGSKEDGIADQYEGIPIKRIHGLPKWLRIFFPRGRDWGCLRSWWEQRQAHRWMRKQKPLVLVAGHLTPLWMPKTEGIIQLGVGHSPDQGNLSTAKRFHSCWDLCVGVSAETSQLIEEQIPALKGRMQTIVNGVSVPELLSEKRQLRVPLRLLYAGRVAQEQKRIFDLIELGDRLHERGIPFELMVAGDGPDFIEFKEKAEGLAWSESLSLLGALPRDEVYALMEMADVFLLASDYEGTPMALLEAMARGCIPVVSRGCGGALGMIETAFPDMIFEVGDMNQAANVIGVLAGELSEIDALKNKAYTAMQSGAHNVMHMIQAYEELIEAKDPER